MPFWTRPDVAADHTRNGAYIVRAVHLMSFASALLAHDAALDEHHHRATFLFVVAQAISSGCRQRLTFFEGLAVSCFHIVHHVAHAPLLLGDSGASDTDGYDDSNNQGVHVCLHCRGCKFTTQSSSNNSSCARWTGRWLQQPAVHLISICEVV